ncbi:uncharacterized protein PHALS_05677 [Plasmopara halstedii]|uniref:Uncharacterized protein n=1 Tax=Plasmopara halstedii TaxID=4781 RepID=A0A0P1B0E7_PLAHL|nr:uncharacterized protein PHALS_05677 [Plasmopara halstedii]CEG48207.1 hypothetical protein PHALS_05677 [Plasmopara halstedii]|eukprot:XP_024584576.1 hypothetical protein PHALS_05677 [Plasmopara halstedii]
MKWWMSLPTDEMYMKLGLSPTDDHKVFVLQVGHLIWEKFKELGENEFSTFMLTKMLERSQDEIMWARIIYDELIKDGTGFPLSSIFDGLIRTKDKGAVGCRPSDAVIFLTSTEFSRMYAAKISRKEAGKMVMKKLLERSKDELMWAKLVYMLKFHEKKPDVFNSVFQSYHADSHTAEFYSPSAAVQDLMKLLDSEQDRKPPSTADDTFLKLRRKSDDEVMWAKLLYILQHYNQDNQASKIVSSRLETIFRSWTKKPEDSVQFSKRLDWRENILKSSQFANLYVYAYFSSDNPSLFLLERLRKLSLVEARWARALNKLRKDESQQVSFSSVLDALLHSWIAQPYFAAAENKSILVDAFDFLLEKLHALSSHQPSPDKLANLVSELLTKSENQYMWAALLYKLQQDQASDENLSKIFDVLLQNHQLDIANVFEIKPIIQRLENLSLEPPISISDPAILHLVLHRVLSLKSDDFMWAKVLYILQNVESKEFKSFFSYLLKTLILKWTTESGVEISLSSENIAKLRTYASCSGDDPDLFLLNALRDLFHDDVKLAHFINEERKKNPDLIGVLSALFCSWIGISYNASTSIEIQRLLVRVYMYLSDKDGIASLRIASFKANQDVGEIILDHLLKESADKVMWAKFLEKLQDDASMHDIVSSVRRSLWNINEWSLTEI